jgi:hypothetical protein
MSMPLGLMYVLVMAPGDGTGSTETFEHGQLVIPAEYQHDEGQERVFPRSKDDVECEGIFPFGSVYPEGGVYSNAVSLELLTVDDSKPKPNLIKLCDLGMQPEGFRKLLVYNRQVDPRVQLTVLNEGSHGFGNPHAVYYAIKNQGTLWQIVGFLAVPKEDKDQALGRLAFEYWEKPLNL